MKLNLYTFKGPSSALIGPWITVGFLHNFYKLNKEIIPSVLLDPAPFNFNEIPSNLSEYDYLLKTRFSMISIPATTINSKGSYSILEAESKIMSYYKSVSLTKHRPLKINKITIPETWDEKLTVLCACFYRKQYLIRRSNHYIHKVNYIELEKNINAHKDLICTFKFLPSNYILSNCISLCKNIEPKPAWFLRELIDLNNILKNKNS